MTMRLRLAMIPALALLAAGGQAIPVHAEENAKLPAPAAGAPRVVFLGDSITDFWRLNEYFPGRDFVNIVKATMDWVDIPLVLFTRVPVADEEEARTLHGADLYVQKGPGAEAALAERLAGVLGR